MMTVEEKPDVTYQDVGGCKDQIQKIREVVELPLLNVSSASISNNNTDELPSYSPRDLSVLGLIHLKAYSCMVLLEPGKRCLLGRWLTLLKRVSFALSEVNWFKSEKSLMAYSFFDSGETDTSVKALEW